MSLRLVLGRAGSGKTKFCIDEILSVNDEALIIVPEQHSFQAEQRLLEKTGITGLGGAQVTSFRRLAQKILAEGGRGGSQRLDEAGKCIAVYNIMQKNEKRLQTFSTAAGGGIATEIADMISEFKRYNITPAGLSVAREKVKGPFLSRKLSDLAFIYEEYENYIKNKFIDTDDDLTELSRALDRRNPFSGTHIYIDQFSSFTPQEYLCLAAFLRGAKRVTVTLCLDSGGGQEFAPTARTKKRLLNLCRELNIPLEPPMELGESRRLKDELKHLEQYFFAYPAKQYEGECRAIEVFAAQNPFTEAEWVAGKIIELCREEKMRFRDIAIAARGLEGHLRLVSSVLERYQIPVFTDSKTPVPTHPIVLFILSALEILIKGFRYGTVFRYAKTGLLDLPENELDLLENYVLATDIKGKAWTDDEKWSVRAGIWLENNPTPEDEEELRKIDGVRRKVVEPLVKLRERLLSGESIKEKCAAVYDFLCEQNIPERVSEISARLEAEGDMSGASEYSKVFNIVVSALDSLVAAAGDEKAGMGRFQNLLEVALSQFEIGIIPSALDQVTLCDIGRVRGHRAKALFIIGANDGVFPAVPDSEGLLTDTDRAELNALGLELAPDTFAQAEEEMHLTYTTLAMPSERLYISYPIADMEGRGMLPSDIISRLKALFPRLTISDDIEEVRPLDKITLPEPTFEHLINALREGDKAGEWAQVYEWYAQNTDWLERLKGAEAALSYRNAPGPLPASNEGGAFYTSVFRLERYSACPFSYFMTYMLKAEERPMARLSMPDAGTFLHTVIDEFSRRLKDNMRSWRDIDDEYIDRELSEIIDELYGRINRYIIESSRRAAFLFARLRRIARRAVILIGEHIRRGEFEPLGYEISFSEEGEFKPLKISLPGGGEIRLTGRIDRMDVLKTPEGDFVRIIDYKSGSKDFDISDIYHGLTLQLAVYLTAVCESGGGGLKPPVKPAGMLYMKLDDPIIHAFPSADRDKIEGEIKKTLKMRGLVLADTDIVEKMGGPAQGYSDILPVQVTQQGFGKNSSVATFEEFSALSKYVRKIVRKISADITAGKIDISPYAKGDLRACDYCPYKAACAFDTSIPGCGYRQLYYGGKDEIWEKIRKGSNDE